MIMFNHLSIYLYFDVVCVVVDDVDVVIEL